MAESLKNMVWLASYPKSGNTWFRLFLGNLLSGSDEPVHINQMDFTAISSNRSILDDFLGIHSSELSAEEIDNLRPEVYRKLSEESEGLTYVKTHEAWTHNCKGSPIFPGEITRGVLYLVRNPLDVAVSYSHHNKESLDETISALNDVHSKLCDRSDRLHLQTQQALGSWSVHVRSWSEDSRLPVHVIKYEDMLDHPEITFRGAVDFLGLGYGMDEIQKAIRNCSFGILKEMEAKDGFRERGIKAKEFFRKGSSGQWKDELTPGQVKMIIDHHGEVMRNFGYEG